MQPTLWNPFREMEDFFNHFRRYGGGLPSLAGEDGSTPWAPLVDISETPKEYLVRAELPGMNKDQVNISVEDGVLTLSGERKAEQRDEKRHRVERAYGSFARSFTLPGDVAEDRIEAEFKDGVLSLHLPRAEQKKAKPIEVKVH